MTKITKWRCLNETTNAEVWQKVSGVKSVYVQCGVKNACLKVTIFTYIIKKNKYSAATCLEVQGLKYG